jgi:hypothetical protein
MPESALESEGMPSLCTSERVSPEPLSVCGTLPPPESPPHPNGASEPTTKHKKMLEVRKRRSMR